LFRFSPGLQGHWGRALICVLGCLTILIAGLAALSEIDIKKIVALSTLRQLGVIMGTLGAQLPQIAFFHLLSHAYFKALLFITVGAIIHISSDYQDLRKVRLLPSACPTSFAFRVVANFRLCGLPFTRGFYSKDACIEIFRIRGSTLPLNGVFYLATALTVAYTTRFIGLLGSSVYWASTKI
jgi:NADH-ubiquinone oxidoreductase chain 5